ncbi:hypothetical protein V6N11_035519 [Hibiscus sabdariffa]|uniref:Uncharacterized protein n=2 Tax=Hibiscus sabdariffa TaxID=183260 RepID=A0ABR2BCU2_9ROSI
MNANNITASVICHRVFGQKNQQLQHVMQNQELLEEGKGYPSLCTMNKERDVRVSAVGRSSRGARPIPKRGQIKSRIAANAFNSIVSVLSKASPNRGHSRRRIF